MLAHYICEIFASDEITMQSSKKAREQAMKTHNAQTKHTA